MRYFWYILYVPVICILGVYVFVKNIATIVLNVFRSKKKAVYWELMPDMDITEKYYHD